MKTRASGGFGRRFVFLRGAASGADRRLFYEGDNETSRPGALIALVCFLLGGLVTLGVVWKVVGQDGRTLLQAYQLIRSEFVGEYDSQTHLETTLETMVDALGDRWSYYLTPEEAQQVKANRENTYVGIGITVGQNVEDGLEILRVTEGSPAQEAGLQAGEIIRGVDGQAITSDNRETMLSAIQGRKGPLFPWKWRGRTGHGAPWRSPARRSTGYRHLDHDGKPGGPGDHPELLRLHRRPGKAGGWQRSRRRGPGLGI